MKVLYRVSHHFTFPLLTGVWTTSVEIVLSNRSRQHCTRLNEEKNRRLFNRSGDDYVIRTSKEQRPISRSPFSVSKVDEEKDNEVRETASARRGWQRRRRRRRLGGRTIDEVAMKANKIATSR